MNNPQRNTNEKHLWIALLLSLLLHSVFLMGFRTSEPQKKSRPISVSLLPREQIVSPSESPEAKEAPQKAFLSKSNSKVEKESIKRGLEPSAPQPPKKISKPQPPRSKQTKEALQTNQKKQKAKPDKLLLANNILQKQFGSLKLEEKTEEQKKQLEGINRSRARKMAQAEPFSRLRTSSTFGSADYLPRIPDGDITLLNTKADRFAVFVHRVALQVFGSLRQKNWAELSRREVQSLDGFAIVRAVMSPQGKLLRVEVSKSSGLRAFDEILAGAAREGTWDQNPPEKAVAADGNIHFIFQARTWSVPNGQIGERRWLLLGTGLG